MRKPRPFATPELAACFDAFPAVSRPHLLTLRDLIYDTADEDPRIGPVNESLKWGQPAYRPARPRTGSTIRLGVPKGGGYALFVHCQTTLIDRFREIAPEGFRFDGKRAVLFAENQAPPLAPLRLLLLDALTYHLKS